MPSLIGSAPNQVPTNGMLGTMAFQDADNALVQNITVTGSSSVPTKVVTDNSTASASTAFVKESQKQKESTTTTTGTGTAYILSPTFTPSEYYTGQTFLVQFHVASGTSPTINISGLGAKNLVRRNADGTFSNVASGDIVSNGTSQIRYNGTAFELTDLFPATSAQAVAGSNTFNYLSPSGLTSAFQGSNQSLTAAGYQRLPGGLIIQWGYLASRPSVTSTHTLPISYTTACFGVWLVEVANTVHNDSPKLASTPTTTSFQIHSDALSYPVYWFSIGY